MARTSSRAYSYPTSGTAARKRQDAVSRQRKPRLNVIKGTAQETARQSSTLLIVATVVAAVLVALAIVCFARIAFASASVTVGMETQKVEAQISADRSAAGALEVQDTVLSNPTRIQDEAGKLDMAAPEYSDEIYLPADVVSTDADGNLSFAESVRRASNQAAKE